MSKQSERPAFVGEKWLRPEQGYGYASPSPSGLDADANLRSPNDWMKVLCIFERAKRGDRAHLKQLSALIRDGQDPDLSLAALDLMGVAGDEEVLRAVIPFLTHPVYDIRLNAYAAADMSGQLFFVEPLLSAHSRRPSSERGMIESALSHLLEPLPDTICDPGLLTRQEYDELVRKTAQEIEEKVGPGVPVFEGQPMSLEHIVNRILGLTQYPDISDYTGKFMEMLQRFEATTGIPSAGLFDEFLVPLPLNIRLAMEKFVREGKLANFPPGVRYFFGHPIG